MDASVNTMGAVAIITAHGNTATAGNPKMRNAFLRYAFLRDKTYSYITML
jgi:hypothetical protein